MDRSDVIGYQQMMSPTLKALRMLGGSASIDELNSKAIEIMQLPEEMLNVPHNDDDNRTEVEYRLAWVRTYLKKDSIIENSSRGIWSLSDAFNGDVEELSYEEIVRKGKNKSKSFATRTEETDNDLMELQEERKSWREILRDALLGMSPDAFERLTLRLLRESGFTQLEVTGKSNDHGIDGKGIIRLNRIMSFHMIFQCKRYKGKVSPSEIRDFRGAMQGRADKGLFITTGTFSAEAKKEATRDGAPALDLMDGDALVERLKDLGLGVKEVKDYEVDTEWFKRI